MLTPIEIQGKAFKSGIGYDKKDVDGYLREVLSNYEALYKQNVELSDKLSVVSEGIQYYKNIEKTLQKSLVLAEKTAEETKKSAQKQADIIEKEAAARAKIILADAQNELKKVHMQTVQMVQQYDKYRIQFEKLAETQIDILNSPAFQIDIANLEAFQNAIEEGQNEKNRQESDPDSKANAIVSNIAEKVMERFSSMDMDIDDVLEIASRVEQEKHIEKMQTPETEEDDFDFISFEDEN